ncbi:ATP-dependent helicase [Methylacidiphilum caldifontis]|uniref:ATP-dependent helicase n=1 Tax=Methylacidiphilum caldifontis TaxID=2795386 RepID=UPI001A8D696C|nr:ATP-dependent helicase [Methylacidiphilum caldifontis]QSR89096.1 ATP-dependent helicase [Methylacidiphilum caldifontis]
MIPYEIELNEEQKKAVTAPLGPILVIAGAGSGKTRTLTYRVAYLIEKGIKPERIILATFTNKAAKEMLSRVERLVKADTTRIWGGTFHHLCNKILRYHANEIGFGQNFTIIDREDSIHLLADCINQLNLKNSSKFFPSPEALIEVFSLSINKAKPVWRIIEESFSHFSVFCEEISKLQSFYIERKRKSLIFDYDDLLFYTVKLFQEKEKILKFYQCYFEYILVDEYQDTSRIQAEFIDLIGKSHQRVMAVGDDAQSIYSWRGAEIENMLSFPKRYPASLIINIKTNYRCTPEILALANAAIEGNRFQFPKELKAARQSLQKAKPELLLCSSAIVQSQAIAEIIQDFRDQGIDPKEIAILYRAHFHAIEIQLELTHRKIPFEITSGIRFFEQAHIKDICSFLRFFVNPYDETAFKRIVKMFAGIGPKTVSKLWDQYLSSTTSLEKLSPPKAAEQPWMNWLDIHKALAFPELANKPSKQLEKILYGFYSEYLKVLYEGYQRRLEDIEGLISFAADFNSTEDFLSQISLLTGVDTAHEEKNGVRLSTIHQAKGLEWKVVFIIMLCEGLFPSNYSLNYPHLLEEERRLFYVAATRAKDRLFLCYPARRSFNNRQLSCLPSRFLEELPQQLVVKTKVQKFL